MIYRFIFSSVYLTAIYKLGVYCNIDKLCNTDNIGKKSYHVNTI